MAAAFMPVPAGREGKNSRPSTEPSLLWSKLLGWADSRAQRAVANGLLPSSGPVQALLLALAEVMTTRPRFNNSKSPMTEPVPRGDGVAIWRGGACPSFGNGSLGLIPVLQQSVKITARRGCRWSMAARSSERYKQG